MTLEQIEQVLADALKLRSPVFVGDVSGSGKVALLEDYMLKSANVNGGLVEARHWLRMIEAKLAEEWDSLQGWEVALKRPRAKATKQDVQAAKMVVAPQLFSAGRKAKRLRESVEDQISRLEREGKVCSRAYTMVTGS